MKEQRNYLVTGTSSGIGRQCALTLSQAGARVFAAVRREEDAASLRALGVEGLSPVMLEVTDQASITAAIGVIEAALGGAPLHGLVNNAGINVGGVLEAISMEVLRRQFEVNVFGMVALTRRALPLLRRARGRIVNVSSAGAALPTPFGGAYAASKIALEALTHAWRRELRPFGIFASVVRPGATESAIWQKEAADSKRWGLAPEMQELYGDKLAAYEKATVKMKSRLVPADRVVRAIEHGLTARRPKATYIVGSEAWLSYFIDRLLPDSMVDYFIDKLL